VRTLKFLIFIVPCVLLYLLFLSPHRCALTRRGARTGSILVILLLLLCVVGLVVCFGSFYSDRLRAAKNLYLFVRDSTTALADIFQNVSLPQCYLTLLVMCCIVNEKHLIAQFSRSLTLNTFTAHKLPYVTSHVMCGSWTDWDVGRSLR
jgi:hypothetical protein